MRLFSTALVVIVLWFVVGMLLAGVARGYDGCRSEPVTPNTPTGIAGCVIYGEGTASRWGGPGVARNDCVWPWLNCTPIVITSLETGKAITISPTMFCDCYTGTPDQRIADLDPIALQLLGLDPSRGLYPVRVEPARSMLPNTAMQP